MGERNGNKYFSSLTGSLDLLSVSNHADLEEALFDRNEALETNRFHDAKDVHEPGSAH